MHYDLIVVLGSQPDTSTWEMPEQIYRCLDRATQLLSTKSAPRIAVCGKWSIDMDTAGLQQSFKECDLMATYLANKAVDKHVILLENESKDTISNLYFLKTKILIPNEFKKLLFVVASFRVPRLIFLCDRILGAEYIVTFEQIEAEPSSSYNEVNTMQRQSYFLAPMQSGDHTWLEGKFFDDPFYSSSENAVHN